MLPSCSIVIVTWNRRKELEPLLESVFAQTIADRLEVIVVDNASTDGTVAWLREAYAGRVRVFAYAENRGACDGRNAGIRAASAPYVCFLDSDAEILSPDAIERCLEHLDANPGTDAVAAPIWFDRAKTNPFLLGGYVTPDGHYHGISCRSRDDEPMLLSTCFAVWRKATLKEVRGFDPWYFWGIEDMDLGLRTYHRRKRHDPGAQPFRIVRGVDVLHEMSTAGRHHDPRSFEQTFVRYERQRLYMVLSYGGLGQFLRVAARGPFRIRRMADAWEHVLTRRQRWQAAVWFPLLRLLALPKNLLDVRRNHLARTTMPVEVTDQSA
ncbi:MAG: glycosyltransferase [Candidatus Sumerlaeia bacterium]|nr:glycosyltransferase [Candidatus Sumerlaeia bacterium]